MCYLLLRSMASRSYLLTLSIQPSFRCTLSAISVDLLDKSATCLFSRSIAADVKVQIVPVVNLGFFLHTSVYKDCLKVDYGALFLLLLVVLSGLVSIPLSPLWVNDHKTIC